MEKFGHKLIWCGAWVVVVFGYLWLLSFAYETHATFVLFVLLAIAGNLAYDGLKVILAYDADQVADVRRISSYVIGFLASLGGSVMSLLLGALVAVREWAPEAVAQVFASIGFLSCMAAGMWLIARAESKFRATKRTRRTPK